MSATDSIPPEDPSLRTQVRALAFQTEGLTRLLLGLESSNRELIGEIRADRQARARATHGPTRAPIQRAIQRTWFRLDGER